MLEVVEERTGTGSYQVIVIHGNAEEKAESLRQQLIEAGVADDISLATFGSVIGTHLGEGSVALAYMPLV